MDMRKENQNIIQQNIIMSGLLGSLKFLKSVVPVEPVAIPAAPPKTKPVEKAPVKKEAAGGC